MRDRLLTPFIRLPWGEDPPGAAPRSLLRSHPARALEGRVVDDGRYLLLRKLGHDRDAVLFSAQDMLSGLLVEVAVAVETDPLGRYRIGSTRLDETPPSLPNLLGIAERQAAAVAEETVRRENRPGADTSGDRDSQPQSDPPPEAKRGWWRALGRLFAGR